MRDYKESRGGHPYPRGGEGEGHSWIEGCELKLSPRIITLSLAASFFLTLSPSLSPSLSYTHTHWAAMKQKSPAATEWFARIENASSHQLSQFEQIVDLKIDYLLEL